MIIDYLRPELRERFAAQLAAGEQTLPPDERTAWEHELHNQPAWVRAAFQQRQPADPIPH